MPYFVPDYMAMSIEDIDFAALAKAGIKYIAFDADSTLVPFRGTLIEDKTKAFLHKRKDLFKGWCIASNRVTNDLQPLAESIQARVIRAKGIIRKPSRRFFQRVLTLFDAEPHEIAMIGDKLLADIFGAKRMGLVTVWVEHLGQDSLVDRITHVRVLEERLIRRYTHQPPPIKNS